MFDMARNLPQHPHTPHDDAQPQVTPAAPLDLSFASLPQPDPTSTDFVFLDDMPLDAAPPATPEYIFLDEMPKTGVLTEPTPSADAGTDSAPFSGTFSLSFDSTTPTLQSGVPTKPKRTLGERLDTIPNYTLYGSLFVATFMALVIAAVIVPGDKSALLVLAPVVALVLGFVGFGNVTTYTKRITPNTWLIAALGVSGVICIAAIAVDVMVILLIIPILAGIAGHFRQPRTVLALGIGMLVVSGLIYLAKGANSGADAPIVATFVRIAALGATTSALAAFASIYRRDIATFEEEKRAKDMEMAVAREIQSSLMPPTEMRSGGWVVAARSVAAREVGGDFFEYIPYLDRPLGGVAIGDVAGKGIPAAMQMAVVRTVFRIEARRRIFPGETLMSVNVALQAERSFGMVTLLYAFVDPTSSILYVANAGHNYPILVNAEAPGSISEIRLPGLPLGIDDEIEYDEKSMVIPEGTSVVLYTDGIVEAMTADGDMFGEERLRATIAAHAAANPKNLVQHIIDAVVDFTAGAPQSDDLTVVVLYRDTE